MSFPIAVIIMLIAGISGGTVNYLLPSNEDAQRSKIRNWIQCVLLGTGATILVPLFLEIAQSKLLDEIHLGYQWQQTKEAPAKKNNADTTAALTNSSTPVNKPTDSSNRQDTSTAAPKPGDTKKETAANKKTTAAEKPSTEPAEVPLKNYLLWTAYCFLAAAAGVRFINNIMDSVIKDRQIANLKDQNAETEKQKQEAEAKKAAAEKQQREAEAQQALAEKEKAMLTMQNKVNLLEAEETVTASFNPAAQAVRAAALPVIGEITYADDPQKGRFGGKREVNNKRLDAAVLKSSIPMFYNVIIWVEATNNQPLKGDIILYLHDSFANPVRVIKEEEFTEGKAVVKVKAWGAFTAGAVCDNGETLLEYDLSMDEKFPAAFREK